MVKEQVSGIISQYIQELEKKITVTKVILYGSFAYGQPHAGSDIDLVVISPEFAKMKPLERLEFLSLATRFNRAPIEAIGYTPEEFSTAKNYIFLDYIVQNGKAVYG
ncbi:MAG: hypothetical protein A2817_00285 [Candidatus Yanofskybacteria bacterium RIFCSPHIGHO2_01_FULL_39_8b]|uniref:Polymerase nucleotidyl transferase domain-containing protein n=1 Tax=Candidatus Yanofskybacteria bacterium RIFCSPHIGHO2_01_FULL_39_8b TaxID=1802659 RepID=A0A1F8EE48_9BACT|nr:MAG: hypothetical protein A2817_00285 [Candidatus Yanofskybacteria bacterium RIFCSPHIGHO2_01_FULL_39_8b]